MQLPLTAATPWTFSEKLSLRFFLLLFVLYIFFNPNGVLPYIDIAFGLYIEPFHNLMIWIAGHVLKLSYPITVFTNGSGDTTYDYVVVFFITVISLVVSVVWTSGDRKPRSLNKLFYWLCVILRFYVAMTMLTYGMVKVIKLQFPFPSPARLVQSYGDSSPMGLAWTFMGYSKGYNYFTGFAELLGGILLFFRRTTTLGALIALMVSVNIMAINYCFDVPVKLLSTTLVLMTSFLLAKDFKRLMNFFILNKTAPPANITPPKFKKRWQNTGLAVFKYLLIVYVLLLNITGVISGSKQYGDDAKKPPFYGIYHVQNFIRNNDTIAPLKTDSTRWDNLIVSWKGGATIKMVNDSTRSFGFRPDSVTKSIVMFSNLDTTKKSTLTYSYPAKRFLLLAGKWNNDSLKVFLRKQDMQNFLLVDRGFHWINERPFNR